MERLSDRWMYYSGLLAMHGVRVDDLEHIQNLIDAEEQGLLMRLLCKVGDTVWTNYRGSGWYFRLKDAPYRAQIVYIGLNNSKEMGFGFFNVCYEKNDHMMQFRFSDIGKTVFLTKAEAEKALAEMDAKSGKGFK